MAARTSEINVVSRRHHALGKLDKASISELRLWLNQEPEIKQALINESKKSWLDLTRRDYDLFFDKALFEGTTPFAAHIVEEWSSEVPPWQNRPIPFRGSPKREEKKESPKGTGAERPKQVEYLDYSIFGDPSIELPKMEEKKEDREVKERTEVRAVLNRTSIVALKEWITTERELKESLLKHSGTSWSRLKRSDLSSFFNAILATPSPLATRIVTRWYPEAPKRESPKREGKSPKREEKSPKMESPKREEKSPEKKEEKKSPKREGAPSAGVLPVEAEPRSREQTLWEIRHLANLQEVKAWLNKEPEIKKVLMEDAKDVWSKLKRADFDSFFKKVLASPSSLADRIVQSWSVNRPFKISALPPRAIPKREEKKKSPKKESPKRESPKKEEKKSPKRESPKREEKKSPKRESPKRESKSPKKEEIPLLWPLPERGGERKEDQLRFGTRQKLLQYGLHSDIWSFKPLSEFDVMNRTSRHLNKWLQDNPVVQRVLTTYLDTDQERDVKGTTFRPSAFLASPCSDERIVPCSSMRREKDVDILVIPAQVILYHGTGVDLPDRVLPRSPAFYTGSIRTAATYAWRDHRKPAQRGKIIVMRTTDDIRLWMPTVRNLKNALGSVDSEGRRLLERAFKLWQPGRKNPGSVPIIRRSVIEEDAELVRWFSKSRLAPSFSGIGYKGMPGNWKGDVSFHDEIILWEQEILQRLENVEYRVSCAYPDCIFEVNSKGSIVSVQSAETVGGIRLRECVTEAKRREEEKTQPLLPSVMDGIDDAFHRTLDSVSNAAYSGSRYPFDCGPSRIRKYSTLLGPESLIE